MPLNFPQKPSMTIVWLKASMLNIWYLTYIHKKPNLLIREEN